MKKISNLNICLIVGAIIFSALLIFSLISHNNGYFSGINCFYFLLIAICISTSRNIYIKDNYLFQLEDDEIIIWKSISLGYAQCITNKNIYCHVTDQNVIDHWSKKTTKIINENIKEAFYPVENFTKISRSDIVNVEIVNNRLEIINLEMKNGARFTPLVWHKNLKTFYDALYVRCDYCLNQLLPTSKKCSHCGEYIDPAMKSSENTKIKMPIQPPPVSQNMVFMNSVANNSNFNNDRITGTKSRIVAAILAFFFGGLGIHKFYLGQTGWGIVYLLFCWTFIPTIISIFESIFYLLSTKRSFALKYG
jgi:hypothetical protein